MSRIAVMAGFVALAIMIAGCAGHSVTVVPAIPAAQTAPAAAPATAPAVAVAASHPATAPVETRSWSVVALPEGVEPKSALRGVFFLDDKLGWVVGDNGLCLATADGGKNWSKIDLQTGATLRAALFLDANNGWICGDGDPGAPPVKQGHVVFGTGRAQVSSDLFHTTDGGKTWKRIDLPTNFEITSLATIDGSTIMLGNSGGENHPDGDTLMLKGAGPQKKFSSHRAFRALFGVAALDEKNWVAVGSRVSVGFMPPPNDELYTNMKVRAIYSDDGGATWKPSAGSDGGVQLRALAYRKDLPLLAVGDKGTVLISDDKGVKWTKVDSTTEKPLRGVAWGVGPSPIAVAVGRGGAVIVSLDAGKTWSAGPAQPSGTFAGIAAAGDAFVAVTAEGTIMRIDAKALIYETLIINRGSVRHRADVGRDLD